MEQNGIWGKIKGLFDWIRNLFFSKELELSIVGLQNAGKLHSEILPIAT